MYTHFFTALFVRCPLLCHLERSCMPLWKQMVLFFLSLSPEISRAHGTVPL